MIRRLIDQNLGGFNVIGRILTYLFLVALIFLALFSATNGRNHYVLSQNSVKTIGTISKTYCEHHQEFEYKFQINGKWFNGIGRAGVDPTCEALRLGDSLDVFYIPDKPNININEEPRAAFQNELISDVIIACIFAGGLLFGRRLKRYLSTHKF